MEVKTSNSGWGTFFVSGLVAIVYGLLALLLPEGIIQTIMLISGIGLIVAGVICGIVSFNHKKAEAPWVLLLIEAIAMVALGVVAIVWSDQTVKVLIFILGLWSVIIGAMMLLALMKSHLLTNRAFYLVSAILSILFGIILIINPFESAKVFITLTGVIALIFGIIMMMFGFAVKKADEGIKVEIVE